MAKGRKDRLTDCKKNAGSRKLTNHLLCVEIHSNWHTSWFIPLPALIWQHANSCRLLITDHIITHNGMPLSSWFNCCVPFSELEERWIVEHENRAVNRKGIYNRSLRVACCRWAAIINPFLRLRLCAEERGAWNWKWRSASVRRQIKIVENKAIGIACLTRPFNEHLFIVGCCFSCLKGWICAFCNQFVFVVLCVTIDGHVPMQNSLFNKSGCGS